MADKRDYYEVLGVDRGAEDVYKRQDQYYDYSEVIEIDLILEEYFNAA